MENEFNDSATRSAKLYEENMIKIVYKLNITENDNKKFREILNKYLLSEYSKIEKKQLNENDLKNYL